MRLHAGRYRAVTCRQLCERIDALLDDDGDAQGAALAARAWKSCARWPSATRRLPRKDWRGALAPLARAGEMARAIKQGRLRIELLGLHAFALDQCGEDSQKQLREAMDLADTYGLRRVFADAHPDLGDWVRNVAAGGIESPEPGTRTDTFARLAAPRSRRRRDRPRPTAWCSRPKSAR